MKLLKLLRIARISCILSLLLCLGCFYIGGNLNRFVERHNGGKMPVGSPYVPAIRSGDVRHVLMTENTPYKYLADILPFAYGDTLAILSIGDVFLYASSTLFTLFYYVGIVYGVTLIYWLIREIRNGTHS